MALSDAVTATKQLQYVDRKRIMHTNEWPARCGPILDRHNKRNLKLQDSGNMSADTVDEDQSVRQRLSQSLMQCSEDNALHNE